MNKQELMDCIRSFRQQVISELDRLEDALISLRDAQEVPSNQKAMPEGWLTLQQVCEYLNISQTTFYEGVKNGVFPKGSAFGPKTIRWRIADIMTWQEAAKQAQGTVEAVKKRGRPSRVRKVKEFRYV